jgi:hypothetical protein
MNAVTGIQYGKVSDLSLAASWTSEWFEWHRSGEPLRILATFAIADAVGTLAIESYPAQTIAFRDENDAPQTTLAVTSALNGLSHEFIIPDAPRTRYRLKYTRTSGGSDDTMDVEWS